MPTNTDLNLLDFSGLRYYDGKIKDYVATDAEITATGSTTGRTLPDRFADVINVKDFGAVGDGTTDDTVAIQAALTAGMGKTVVFPSGIYIITSTPVLTGSSASGTTCIGYGATIALASYMPDEQTIATGISGLRFVGASNITIRGIKFHKVWHGIDVFYSMTESDYPATEVSNIHDIRIENCEFDTSAWAMSLVGIYGLTVCNCTINQDRLNMPEDWNGYSNRDGIHLHGCVNVLIDNIIGATDDDFIAISPKETYLFSTTTFYGVMKNVVITNCVMNNNLNGVSESGSFSFVGLWGGELPVELQAKYDFSVDNIQVSNCSIETDVSPVLRCTGGLNTTTPTIGRIVFSDNYINRSYVEDKVISSSWAWMYTVLEPIDELIIKNCIHEVDQRWSANTLQVGFIRTQNNIRSLVINGCSFVGTATSIVVEDSVEEGVTPAVSKMDNLEIIDSYFNIKDTGAGGVMLQIGNKRAVKKVLIRNVRLSGKITWYTQMFSNSSIDDLFLDALAGGDTAGTMLINARSSSCAISRIHVSNVTGTSAIVSLPETQSSFAYFSMIGDFSSPTRAPFDKNVGFTKVSGMSLADSTWCTASDNGSLAIVGGSLAVMDNGTWKSVALQ